MGQIQSAGMRRGSDAYHNQFLDTSSILEESLKKEGVDTGKHYPVPIHLQPCFSSLGYKQGDFPVSERLSKEILSLPMFPTLKKKEIKYVADRIKKFY